MDQSLCCEKGCWLQSEHKEEICEWRMHALCPCGACKMPGVQKRCGEHQVRSRRRRNPYGGGVYPILGQLLLPGSSSLLVHITWNKLLGMLTGSSLSSAWSRRSQRNTKYGCTMQCYFWCHLSVQRTPVRYLSWFLVLATSFKLALTRDKNKLLRITHDWHMHKEFKLCQFNEMH